MSLDNCLNEVATAWAKAPLVNHYLTPDDLNDLPDPWNLINDNIYCDLGIALGMVYTFSLCDNPHITNDVSLEIYQSNEGWINLCSVNSGLYMLNWAQRSVVNKSTIPNLGNPIFVYTKIDLASKLN
jgi:hypothetical protein